MQGTGSNVLRYTVMEKNMNENVCVYIYTHTHIYTHTTESLFCTAEINTTLSIIFQLYTYINNILGSNVLLMQKLFGLVICFWQKSYSPKENKSVITFRVWFLIFL